MNKLGWMSLAGRDPAAATEQLDRQTSELLGYVQQQNEELDARQAELNAKLAQLDNELRAARLQRETAVGADLLQEPADRDRAQSPRHPSTASPSVPTPDPVKTATEMQEFEEVQQLVKQIMGNALGPDAAKSMDNPLASVSASPSETTTTEPAAEPVAGPVPSVDSYPYVVTDSHVRHEGPGRPRMRKLGWERDASPRMLAERKLELDRRRAVVERMQDEAQSLHKEALEMRMVTEQLWAELSHQVPADKMNELLAGLRARLDEQYAVQSTQLDERKAELNELRETVQQQQEAMREQSQKLQEWVESRHDHIKSFAAEIDAREALLDQREHRIREEISRWEARRTTQQEQMKQLIAKLNLAGVESTTGIGQSD